MYIESPSLSTQLNACSFPIDRTLHRHQPEVHWRFVRLDDTAYIPAPLVRRLVLLQAVQVLHIRVVEVRVRILVAAATADKNQMEVVVVHVKAGVAVATRLVQNGSEVPVVALDERHRVGVDSHLVAAKADSRSQELLEDLLVVD